MIKSLKKVSNSILINIIFNIFIAIFGIILMCYPQIGYIETTYYLSMYFFVISGLSIIAYFIGRIVNNYENLFFSLISLISGVYLYIFRDNTSAFVLANSLLLFSFLTIVNQVFRIIALKKYKDYDWAIKTIEIILITILSFLSIVNLYCNVSVPVLMFGFYFIAFGLISLFEPCFLILIESKYFKRIIGQDIEEEKLEQELKKQAKKKNTKKKEVLNKKEVVKPVNKTYSKKNKGNLRTQHK